MKSKTLSRPLTFFPGKALLPALVISYIFVSGLPLPKEAAAVEIKGAAFSDTISTRDHEFHLRGAGTLTWKIFFTVYSAALYLPPDVSSDAVLEDVPKRLEFHYLVDVKAETFSESASPYLEKNLDEERLAMLRPKIDSINRLYRDVKSGDRYALTYTPGKGTTLSLNGEELGTIEGGDFASAYFTIWLGEKPISRSLKRSLLSGNQP